MTYATDLAATWRTEIERMKVSIPLWEGGQMRVSHNGVDVTAAHIANLHRMIRELEAAMPILAGRAESPPAM